MAVALPLLTILRCVFDEQAPEQTARAGWSYSGEAWTDAQSRAVVTLPPFVRTHTAGFDYELAALDSEASATLAEEIRDGRFAIATSEPHVKVAWKVTAWMAVG